MIWFNNSGFHGAALRGALRYFNPLRKPDFIVYRSTGEAYLRRWWVIPRNKRFNIYLHNMLADDDDRALHDHPWRSMSVCLKGRLREHRKDLPPREIGAGRVVFRGAEFAHRLDVIRPAWTLFITGRSVRSWGFHCPNGWRHWRDFTAPSDTGKIGRGCE